MKIRNFHCSDIDLYPSTKWLPPCLLMRCEPMWKWFQIATFSHRVRSSQVKMLCIIDKYRLCEFHLNVLTGQKGEFCDFVTLGHLYKIHHTGKFKRACAGQYTINWGHLRDKESIGNSYRSLYLRFILVSALHMHMPVIRYFIMFSHSVFHVCSNTMQRYLYNSSYLVEICYCKSIPIHME